MKRIYLDYAATTPTHPKAVEAMLPYFTKAFGNTASLYSYGHESREAMETARKQVATLIGAKQTEIVFTSGGTEADNFALKGSAFASFKTTGHIITTCIEHHAVLETCRFLESLGHYVTYLPVDQFGLVDPDDVKKAITAKTFLISVMHANNEIGTIQPILEISQIAREAGICFHTDAVQTVGHIPVNVNELGVDLLSISAHKLYGPKDIGALYVRNGIKLSPLLHGGGQEEERRSGTSNLPGMVGFGKAAEIAATELISEAGRLTELRDSCIGKLYENIDLIHLNGHPVKRLPNNINVSIEFIEGETLCLNLDLEGICVANGSACSSLNKAPSHVITAIGVPRQMAQGSLRVTMGKWSKSAELERLIDILPALISKLRTISSLS